MSKVAKPSDNSDTLRNPQGHGGDYATDSADPAAAGNSELDLALLAKQHLTQLKQFGVSFIPAGSGRDFELAESAADSGEPKSKDSQAETAGINSGDRQAKAAAATQVPPAATPQPSSQPSKPLASADSVAEPKSAETLLASASNNATKRPPTRVAVAGVSAPYSPKTGQDAAGQLQVLGQEVANCTQCESLAANRNNTVFGVGNPNARLVLVGEAPGEDEDKKGEPFVGAAGVLLDKMLAACGLNRHEHVYILNTIKCRPPQNRNPKPDELESCWGYAQRQLDILQPEFICCLGSVAARTLLQTTQSVGRLRKQFHVYRGSKVLVTYHPAYLLRTTSAKRHAWDDMKMLMREMGVEIPKR